jgi:hypothetical protein
VNLLIDIGSGVPFAAAFERHVLMPFAEFQKRLAADTR